MKRYIRSQSSLDFIIDIVISYRQIVQDDVAASMELDSMNLSGLDQVILNMPSDHTIDINSDAYQQFIYFVNKVDELLELRQFEILGESEYTESDSESTYRGVVLNISNGLNNEPHVSGKVMNTLRLSGHKETRSSRRTRASKLSSGASSDPAKLLNNGDPLVVGEFESIVVKCTVPNQQSAVISNKEFYSYLDAIKCVDNILDRWSENQ